MRLANLRRSDSAIAHVRTDRGYVDVRDLVDDMGLTTVDSIVQGGTKVLDRIRSALEERVDVPLVAAEDVDYGPAIGLPGKIFCLGRNYYDHAIEMAGAVPKWPEVFIRVNDSLAGPYDDIEVPASSSRFDYEGELGVVVGTVGRGIPAAQAMRYVAGFVTTNDFSARDWQRAAGQWTPGKNFDRSCPLGPDFVTADELGSSFDLAVETRVNGVIRQKATTGQMIVDIPAAIEFLSCFTTLRPGDVILTGTPGGVGDAQKPPAYLRPGDVVETSIERVGTLRNTLIVDANPIVDTRWNPARSSAPVATDERHQPGVR